MPGLFCTEGDNEASFVRGTLAENEGKRHIYYQMKTYGSNSAHCLNEGIQRSLLAM